MNLRRFSLVVCLLLATTASAVRAQDNGDVPPPPTPSPQAPAPQAPTKTPVAPVAPAPPVPPAPQSVQPVSPGATVAQAIPLQPTTTIAVPAQTVLLKQEAPKVYIIQEPAPAQAVVPTQYVAPAPKAAQAPAPEASVTPVAIVKEKSKFCQALGVLGTRMSGLGQPTVKMGVANVTTAPATTVQAIQMPAKNRTVIVQQAPTTTVVQQAPAPMASPQASAQTASGYQMISVSPKRTWWNWSR